MRRFCFRRKIAGPIKILSLVSFLFVGQSSKLKNSGSAFNLTTMKYEKWYCSVVLHFVVKRLGRHGGIQNNSAKECSF